MPAQLDQSFIFFFLIIFYSIVTVDRQERGREREGMTRSKGPQVGFKSGPLQRTQPTWGASSYWGSQRPPQVIHLLTNTDLGRDLCMPIIKKQIVTFQNLSHTVGKERFCIVCYFVALRPFLGRYAVYEDLIQPTCSDGQMKLRKPLSLFSELTRWRSLFKDKG